MFRKYLFKSLLQYHQQFIGNFDLPKLLFTNISSLWNFYLNSFTNIFTESKLLKFDSIKIALFFNFSFFNSLIAAKVFSLFLHAKINVSPSRINCNAASLPIPSDALVKIIIFPSTEDFYQVRGRL